MKRNDEFTNRIKNGSLNNLNIDAQNIHNLIIQSSFRDSINNITEITYLLKYGDTIHKLIINDNIYLRQLSYLLKNKLKICI